MKTKIFTGQEIFSLKEEWNRLFKTCPTYSLFLSWPWIETLVDLVKSPPLQVLAVFEEGPGKGLEEGEESPIGLVPLYHGKQGLLKGLSAQGIHLFPSSTDWPAHFDFLVQQGKEELFFQSLWQWLESQKGLWISLRRFQKDSPFLERFLSFRPSSYRTLEEWETPCPVISLPSTEEELLKSLTKTFRKKVLYKERRLAKEFQVEFGMTSFPGNVEEVLQAFIQLHQKRLEQKNLAKDLEHQPYFPIIYQKMAEKTVSKELRLSYLKLDGTIRAVEFDFRVKNGVICWNSGIDPEFGRYSLGHILTLHTLRWYLQEGVEEVNLLHGYELYKFMWADKLKRDVNFLFFPPGFRSFYLYQAGKLFKWAKYQKRKKEHREEKEKHKSLEPFLRMEIPVI